MQVNIIDNQFGHGTSFGYGDLAIHPKHFQWDRSGVLKSKHIFITEDSFHLCGHIPKDLKVALILEPKSINEKAYVYARDHQNEFKYILTHDKDFTRNIPNALYYPFGGCWIDPFDRNIHPKTKLISIIASEKTQTEGHRLRHQVIKDFPQIDVFGRGYKPIKDKSEALKDYAYSVIIENEMSNGWFTEKLIDCIQCGTIPIYWGAPDISDYFSRIKAIMDISGLRTFMDFEEKSPGFGFRFYKSKQAEIKAIFERSKQYICPEDYIFNNYKYLFI